MNVDFEKFSVEHSFLQVENTNTNTCRKYYINVKEYRSFINLKYNLKKLPGINIGLPKSSRNIDVYVTDISLKEV